MQSFLQALQFNSKFMRNTEGVYSDTKSLRQLFCKGTNSLCLGEEQQTTYNEIIQAHDSDGTMYLYNPDLDMSRCRGSTHWDGIIHVHDYKRQDGKRKLVATESCKLQSHQYRDVIYPKSIEKVQHGGIKQNWYNLLGRQFIAYTDQKPLLPFYTGTKRTTP